MIYEPSEIALVSGAAPGIGRATALRLAERAACVGLIDRAAAGLAATADAICSHGGTSRSFAVDTFCRTAGGLDTIVSCAGIVREQLLHEIDEEDWCDVIAVNLAGTFLLAKHSFPWLLKRDAGSFVTISSDSSVLGTIGYGAYCASKHGVIGMIRCMALEYGPAGIRGNAVCPAFVETPMADGIFARAGRFA